MEPLELDRQGALACAGIPVSFGPSAKPGSAAGTGLVEVSQSATHLLPVLLSIEPVGTSAESDVEAPVVFPGYLLPEDNREEPAHGGS